MNASPGWRGPECRVQDTRDLFQTRELIAQLLDIRNRKRNWPYVAAIRADEFFESPSLRTFENLCKAVERAGVWTEVRKAVLNYIVTGKCPGHESSGGHLPDTKLRISGARRAQYPPFTEVLIDIVIKEKNVDEILRWHELRSKGHQDLTGWWWGDSVNEKVADVIVDNYPGRSMEIWKRIAEGYISRISPKAYSIAVEHLRKVQKVMKENGMDAEWPRFLSQPLLTTVKNDCCFKIFGLPFS